MALERPALNKQKAAGLTFPPDWAAIILAAPWAGTRSEFGFPANELYAVDLKGKKYKRLTRNNYLYNHFAVSPDRKMIAAIRYSDGDTNQNGQIDFRDKKTLWILDLENKEEWPLLSEYDTGWGGVDWSPDNQYVYVSIPSSKVISRTSSGYTRTEPAYRTLRKVLKKRLRRTVPPNGFPIQVFLRMAGGLPFFIPGARARVSGPRPETVSPSAGWTALEPGS